MDASPTKILVVSRTPAALAPFGQALATEAHARISFAPDGRAALAVVAGEHPALVVVDQKLPDLAQEELVQEIMAVDAGIDVALVSPLPPEEFHDTYEGLGLIGQLPPQPGLSQARELAAYWRQLHPQS
ncbi:MAG: hypothetical protein KQJ78_08460 [Deltaproteobacteria bacterium]|nr:hypothetical protein [Deltaproteobacteria bacterium]